MAPRCTRTNRAGSSCPSSDDSDCLTRNDPLTACSHEHDRGKRVSGERCEHGESVELRHLHVEKHEVGRELPDRA